MKKIVFVVVIVIFSLVSSSHFVKGQEKDFPNRPIEMVVPFPPGGTADISVRIVVAQLSEELKASVVVINKPGASGTIGTNWVVKGNPNGHLLLAGNPACLIIPYFFLKNVPFDTHGDLLPIAYVGESPSVLAVQNTSPFKSFEEMINYAKKNPGKLSYATSAGLASVSTLNMEVVKNQTGIDVSMIVYEGGGPSLTAILGGHVDIVATSIPALGPHVEAGKIRVLVATKKIEGLPNVPTLAELGFPMVINWTGFFAPSKIPRGAYNILINAFDKALKNPEVIKKLKSAGYVPERKTPAEMTELIKSQYNLVSKIVKESKVVK